MAIFASESTLDTLYRKIYEESSDASSWSRDRAIHFATLRELCKQLAQYIDPLYAFAIAVKEHNVNGQYGIIQIVTWYPNLIRPHFAHYLSLSDTLPLSYVLPILKRAPILSPRTIQDIANMCAGNMLNKLIGFLPICAELGIDPTPFIEPLEVACEFSCQTWGIVSKTPKYVVDVIRYLHEHANNPTCELLIIAVMRHGSIDDMNRILRVISVDNKCFKRGIVKMIAHLCHMARTQYQVAMLVCNLIRDTMVPYGNRVMLQRKSICALSMIASRAEQMGVPYGSIAPARTICVSLSDPDTVSTHATEKYVANLRAKFIAKTDPSIDDHTIVDSAPARLAYLRPNCSYDDLKKAHEDQNPSSFAMIDLARHIRGPIISHATYDTSFATFARIFAPISLETCVSIISSDTWRVWLCNEPEDRSFIKRDRHQLYNALIQITAI